MADKQEGKKSKRPWSIKRKAVFWPFMAFMVVLVGVGVYYSYDYISGMLAPMMAFHVQPVPTPAAIALITPS